MRRKFFAYSKKKNTYSIYTLRIVTLFFIFHSSFFISYGQHPVTSRSIIKTPYSAALSDYYTSTDPRLTLYLTNTDLRQPVIRARLRLNITSNQVNLRSRDFVGPIIELDAGIPQILSGTDLAIYFNPSNMDVLSGLDYNALFKSHRLPDGTYTFRFDVVEAFTGQVLNDIKAFQAPINILSSDPPFLNLPRKGDNIRFTDPLNIVFNWTPRALIKGTTEYEFSLYEIYDNGMPPENAPFMSQPIYQTTTQTTTLLYGPTEPPLLPGKRYAWRIRAVAKQGIDSYSIYNNDGYTETYWFQLNDNCDPITQISATVRGGAVTLEWPENPNMYEYVVEYRKKGDWNRWFNTTTKTNKVIITDVAPGNTYEYRVGGTCTVGAGATFSDIRAFTIPPRDSVRDKQCGILPNINLSNQKILESLNAGETVMVGDYPATILNVKADGNGMFSGTAAIKMDVFRITEASVKTTFNSVVFNTDKQLIKGFFVTTYDSTGKQIVDLDKVFEGGKDVGAVKTGLDSTNLSFNFPINKPEDIKVTINPDGSAVLNITGANGETKQITVPQLPVTIQDSQGNIYNVDKDGKVTKVGNAGKYKGLNFAQFNVISTDKAVVQFKADDKQQYAFDEWKDVYNKSQLFKEKYELLSGDYHVSAKAIEAAKTDVVKATIQIKDNSIKADSVKFVTGKGTHYESKYLGNNEYEITVVGGPSGDAQELYAIYPNSSPNGGGQVGAYLSFGKLLISSYPHKKQKLILVSVNGASVDKNKIADSLNSIYKKIAIEFDVQTDVFNDKSWDIDKNDALQVDGSGLFSTLTDEMKALNNAYRSKRSIDKSTIYLFILSQAAKEGVVGDMPRAKQFGYLFNGSDGKTAAHEVGHGLFHLKHSFDSQYGLGKGELTGNVMDYPNGDQFSKLQWDAIHDPGLVIGLFDSDGDAMLEARGFVGSLPKEFLNPDSTTYTFITPAGQYITLPKEAKTFFFNTGMSSLSSDYDKNTVIGTLNSFEYKGKTYSLLKSGGKNIYEDEEGNKFEDYRPNVPLTHVIMGGLQCGDEAKIIKFKATNLKPYSKEGGNILSEIDFPFIPYKGSNEQVASKDFTSYLKEAGKIETNGYCNSEALLPKIKLGMLNDMYPLVMVEFSFVGTPNGWTNYLDKNPGIRELKNTNPYKYYAILVGQAIQYIEKQIDKKALFLQNLNEKTKYEEVCPILWRMSNDEFNSLTLAQRVLLLRIMTQRSIEHVIAEQDNEKAAMSLIVNTPEDQTAEFLDSLIQLKDWNKQYASLLMALTKDGSGLDGDEYRSFVSWLYPAIVKYKPCATNCTLADIANAPEDDRKALFFKPGFWLGHAFTESFTDDGKIKLSYRPQFTLNEKIVTAAPYQYIFITANEDYTLGSIQFKKGTIKVPAYMGYALFNEENSRRLLQGGKLVLNVASMAVGVGEIAAAYRALNAGKNLYAAYVAAKAFADIGIGIASIYVDVKENEWSQTEEGRARLSFWYKLQALYATGRISQEIIEAGIRSVGKTTIKTEDDFDKFKQGTGKTDKEIDDLYKQYIDGSVVNTTEGLLKYTDIQESMTVIQDLKKSNKLAHTVGMSSDIELAAIHRYTVNGDFLNIPMRQQSATLVLDEFGSKTFEAIKEGLKKLRQTSRLYNQEVFRGRTFSLSEFNELFNTNKTEIPLKGFISTTKDKNVAIDFIAKTSNNLPGKKIKCILKIKSKNGVDIDDISDWGKNLVSQKHPGNQAQLEVLLEEGYFKPIGQPKPILENGIPKVDNDGTPWMEIELEELIKPIR